MKAPGQRRRRAGLFMEIVGRRRRRVGGIFRVSGDAIVVVIDESGTRDPAALVPSPDDKSSTSGPSTIGAKTFPACNNAESGFPPATEKSSSTPTPLTPGSMEENKRAPAASESAPPSTPEVPAPTPDGRGGKG